MMRVLFFNYEYPPLGGGAANATSYILREFSKIHDLKVDLVTSSVSNYQCENISENITIHRLDIHKRSDWHYQSLRDLLTYSWKAYFYSKKLMKKNRYDLCHAFLGIPSGFIAMKTGLPYVVSLRGSDVPFYNERFYFLDTLIFRWLSKHIWKKAASVVALSHDLVNIARKTSSEQKIEIIYNGIDTEEFQPDPEILNREKHFNILFIGRLIERKGFIYLLEAFEKFFHRHPEARLIVISDGPLKETYINFAKEKNISESVLFLGIVKHEEIPAICKKSHVFVLPSLNEALANVTQEALASGLPIITTKTGAAELVEDNGIIVRKKSSIDIENALEELINDKDLLYSMSQKSRQLAEKMSWKTCADKYLEIYRKIIK